MKFNTKLLKTRHTKAFRAYCLILLFSFLVLNANAEKRFAVANGNWNDESTWSATSGGDAGASVPKTGDIVIIEGGFKVKIFEKVICDSIVIFNCKEESTVCELNNGTLIVNGGIVISSTEQNGMPGAIKLLSGSKLSILGDITLIGITDDAIIHVKNNSELNLKGDLKLTDKGNKKAELNGFDNARISIGGTVIFKATFTELNRG